ncbi:MAG: ROK family protein [Chloroflexota bacterium]
MTTREVFGAVEGGGTKFVCMVGTGPSDVVDEVTIPTTNPADTIGAVIEFLARKRPGIALAALGVATFGPIGLDPRSETYGRVLKTTKEEWSGARVLAPIARRLGVPIGWDTDVNGAILGEARWGAAQGIDPALYLTVGTGIGGGALVNGATVHGLLHPEMGHLPVPSVPGDSFPGICSFHGHCLEGVASGPAIAARIGRPVAELRPEDPTWDLVARYLAYGISSLVLALSPRRVVLGGGVMKQPHLLPRVRRAFVDVLNGYVDVPEIVEHVDEYLVLSSLDQRAGLFGAVVLAERALAGKGGGS